MKRLDLDSLENLLRQMAFLLYCATLSSVCDSIAGLQFENMVLNNRKKVQALLGLKEEEILADNPYFQNKTTKQHGCQIDYLIQTRYNTLFVCEIKCSKKVIEFSVVQEMKNKIAKLALPKGYACLPVLIHVNGVSESINEAGYFFKIIDFACFLDTIR